MALSIGNGWQIRSWQPQDVAALAIYANNRKVWINLRDHFPHPYTLQDAVAWTQRARERVPETDFAIASPEEAIGGIGLTLQSDVHRRTAEIGYWLGEPYWGRGIATGAVRALSQYAFAHFDLVRLQACVFQWNHDSMRVLEKAGFTLEARLRRSVTKDGKTIDMVIYALLREGE